MSGRYQLVDEGFWNDDKLEGIPFEGKAFYNWLFTHDRIRPSGIYRVTDQQIHTDTGLSPLRIKTYLSSLSERTRIIRDGSWLFVRKKFKRTPKHKNTIRGVVNDLKNCGSITILIAFSQEYPRFKQTVDRRLADLGQTVDTGSAPPLKPYLTVPNLTLPNQSLLREIEEEKNPLSGVPDRGGDPSLNGFNALWSLHPGPKGPKGEALKVYKQVKPPEEVAIQALKVQVEYKAACDRMKVFCAQFPHLHRWLKKRRWEDEIPPLPGAVEETPQERSTPRIAKEPRPAGEEMQRIGQKAAGVVQRIKEGKSIAGEGDE